MTSEHCDFCGTVAALRFRADPHIGGHLCPECIAAADAADAADTGEAPATCNDCGHSAPLTRLGDAHAGQDLCVGCYATARQDVDAQGERI